MENRIYEKAVSIDMDQVQKFYNERAKKVEEKGTSVVLLQEHDSDSATKEDAFEKNYILPKLQLSGQTRVLELGCGIGRLAEAIIPSCGFYCGVDFSEEMIRAAGLVCGRCGSNYQLYTMSCSEAIEKGNNFFGGKFDCLVVSGIFMYINDEELVKMLRAVPDMLSEHSVIYFLNPVGVGRRLTLKDFYSNQLGTTYNAIFRTPEEYTKAYQPLFQAGFSILERGPIPQLEKQYEDSDRWYIILRR